MKTFSLIALLTACAWSQDISGSIAGAVVDASSSAVPGAKVSIINVDRNQTVRTLKTDNGGNYSAPFVPIGTFQIKVEAAGFKTATREGVTLNVADNLKINISLEVGSLTEVVEVRENAVGVELASPANATTIDGEQIRELSLGSRNYQQLVALMPGVTASTTDELYIGVSSPSGTAATLPYSINGSRNSGNNWSVDGADNVDRGSNLTLLNYPSVDAISQFKVERSLYTADAGRAGGGQISVATKSGTRKFHGSLYEFNRNDAYAANNFANNANRVNVINGKATVAPLRWNDFGYTIGGPIYIPRVFNKNKNKTFFFFSQEFRRILTYTTFNPTIPTSAMAQGNFTQPVCVSYSAGACQEISNQIAPAQINPISAQYLKDIFSKLSLSPATTTGQFFLVRNQYNSRQELVRLDHQFSEKVSVWGRFLNDNIPTVEPGGLFTGSNIPNGATTSTNAPGRSYATHAVNIVRPTLINDAGFNFSRGAILSTPIGLTQKSQNPDINVPLPFANTQGVVSSLQFTGGSSILGYGPYTQYNRNYNFFDTITWLKGAHTVKIGFSANRYQKTENSANNQGTFAFSNLGAPSGTSSFNQSSANFLLGNVATFTQTSRDITPDLKAWQTEAFAQDDYRLNRRTTIYVGVRWSYLGQPTDSHNLLDNFYPKLYNPASAPQINPANGNIIPGTGSSPALNGIIVGGSTSPFGDKVANDKYANFAPRVGIAFDPVGDGKTSIRSGYGIYYDSGLFGIYEQNTFANPPFVQSVNYSNTTFQNPAGGTLNVSPAPLVLHATQIPALVPYSQQWSLSVQHQFSHGFFLDAGYHGSKGTHLLGIVDINQAYPGAALAAGLHTATAATPTVFTTADGPRINAVRPYLGFNAINTIEAAFDSNYHSLQVSARKRFKKAGFVNVAYTYSKNLTDNASDRSNAPQNSYNWHEGEYGPATLDRTHVFTANYVYYVPFFHLNNRPLNYVFRGWELTGITTVYTGSPFTVTTSGVDPAGLGLLGSSAASSRPDAICNPNENAPHTTAQWFNTACFAPVPQGAVRPGNAGRGIVRGPGFQNWDVTLSKNFRIAERYNFQLRGETFNTFNHTNPSGFGSVNITSTLFGQITGYRAPRRMQIAAKFTF